MGETAAAGEVCAQRSKALTSDDRVASGDRLFCRAVSEMSTNVRLAVGLAYAALVVALCATSPVGLEPHPDVARAC